MRPAPPDLDRFISGGAPVLSSAVRQDRAAGEPRSGALDSGRGTELVGTGGGAAFAMPVGIECRVLDVLMVVVEPGPKAAVRPAAREARP